VEKNLFCEFLSRVEKGTFPIKKFDNRQKSNLRKGKYHESGNQLTEVREVFN